MPENEDATYEASANESTANEAPTITLDSLMSRSSAGASSTTSLVPASTTEELVTKQLSALSEEDRAKVNEIASQINFAQTGIEQTYGADAQRSMADFSDTVLEKVRSKDSGNAGELLRELVTTIDDSSLSGLKKVPIIGTIAVKIDQIRREYQKVEPQVDEIVGKLDRFEKHLDDLDRISVVALQACPQIKILQNVNDQLISTIKDTIEVQKQRRAQREEAQVKMRQMEADLKTALIEQAQSM